MRPAYCNAYANAATMRSSSPLWPFHVYGLGSFGEIFLGRIKGNSIKRCTAWHSTSDGTEFQISAALQIMGIIEPICGGSGQAGQ